jgi:hypothetical protein
LTEKSARHRLSPQSKTRQKIFPPPLKLPAVFLFRCIRAASCALLSFSPVASALLCFKIFFRLLATPKKRFALFQIHSHPTSIDAHAPSSHNARNEFTSVKNFRESVEPSLPNPRGRPSAGGRTARRRGDSIVT